MYMALYKHASRDNNYVTKQSWLKVLEMSVNRSLSCCHRGSPEVIRAQAEPTPEPAPAETIWVVDSSSSEAEAADTEEVEFRGPNQEEINLPSVWYYCVWKFSPGSPDWKGIHWGFDPAAYDGIRRINDGHLGGLKWLLADSYQGAVELYRSKRSEVGEAEGDLINFYLWK